MMLRKKITSEIAIDICKRYLKSLPPVLDVRKAYIFGSFAKGTQREDSDIDIAVVLGKMDDFFEVQMELYRRRRRIDL